MPNKLLELKRLLGLEPISPIPDKKGLGATGQLKQLLGIGKQQEFLSPVADSPTPTMAQRLTPTPTPAPPTPTPTPTLIPWQTRELPYEERPYHQDITDVWGDKTNTGHDILRYIEEETGDVKGENVPYDPKKDTFNKINPETGKYDENAPIATFPNPLTGEMEQSVDRGLFRINNKTFYDYQIRYPDFFKENNINSWEDMLDVKKNIALAKFIYDTQKKAWYAAKPSTGARLE